MVDSRNMGTLTGGMLADPEVIDTKTGNKIVKFRMGADYAGTEGGTSGSGYFDVVYYANPDDRNSKFVISQIDAGNLKRGSQIGIVYRLNQERWEQEGSKRSKIVLVAESVNYAGGPPKTEEGGEATSGSPRREETVVSVPAKW